MDPRLGTALGLESNLVLACNTMNLFVSLSFNCFVYFSATYVDNENQAVTKAKYFIRDEFLVSRILLYF